MSDVAQLLVPALRWDSATGFDGERARIEQALAMGVGGFILFGGEQEVVRALTKSLQLRSRVPLLIGSDMERGAGQQFSGATALPPLAAIASLGDADLVRRAGRLTAREARTLGVNWDYAPVCDLDVVPENPIVGTRSLGSDPAVVAKLAAEWVDACQAEGVLACAKHFPGHGRTTVDSHAALPVVTATAETLHNADLLPFRATIDAGVASIMTAHILIPALDAERPGTLSPTIVDGLLKQKLGYKGLVLSDDLEMKAISGRYGHSEATVQAIAAGCDAVLMCEPAPEKQMEALEAVIYAVEKGRIPTKRIEDALARHRRVKERFLAPPRPKAQTGAGLRAILGRDEHQAVAAEMARFA